MFIYGGTEEKIFSLKKFKTHPTFFCAGKKLYDDKSEIRNLIG